MKSVFIESASHGPEFVFIKLEIEKGIILQTIVKTERRLLRQAVFQPQKLTVPLRVVYGIKEYLYCCLIHFCNTFDDNNRSVSFGFVRFRSVSWKRAIV